nr:type I 3-dehydroquinate dehydratase [Blastocatellia bacterium]
MNNGKICISINARSADELSRGIHRAIELADVIEIRFDLLKDVPLADVLNLLENFPAKVEFLATSRPTDEGYSTRGLHERIVFWRAILESNRFTYIDLEDDLVFTLTYNDAIPQDLLDGVQIVGSHHDFFASPPDMGPVLKVFEPDPDYPFRCNIVKVAASAHSITDTIEQWYLLDWAKHHGLQSVPISMGEPGKWTRILGLAHGSFMTYAALDEGTETAPGQI